MLNRGARRQPIFRDDKSYSAFLSLLGELPERYGVRLHGFALMPNHFHLLIQTPNANLSRAVSHVSSQYVKWLNDRHGWDGPLFRGRFRSRLVDDDVHWRHLLAFIHLNPIRSRLTDRMKRARWTSHPMYTGAVKAPSWLYRDEMLNLFGSVEAYVRYVHEMRLERMEEPAGFETVRLTTPAPQRPYRPPSSSPAEPSPQQIFEQALEELQEVTGLPRESLIHRKKGRGGNRAFWLTVWWLRRHDRITGAALARLLGLTPGRVSQILTRARSHRASRSNDELKHWMKRLEASDHGAPQPPPGD